jgi:hypothetical protein
MAGFDYNSLPPVEEASKALNEVEYDYLSILGQLLIKYGVHSRLGISLIHRHFCLEDDEQLTRVRVRQSDEVISTVFKNGVPDSQIAKDHDLLISESSKLVPSMFIIRPSGIVPYEFCCIEEEDANILYFNTLSRIDDDFISEWATILDGWNMADRLGLAILSDNSTCEVEAMCSNKRVRIFRQCAIGGDKTEYIPTVWMATGPVLQACQKDEHTS